MYKYFNTHFVTGKCNIILKVHRFKHLPITTDSYKQINNNNDLFWKKKKCKFNTKYCFRSNVNRVLFRTAPCAFLSCSLYLLCCIHSSVHEIKTSRRFSDCKSSQGYPDPSAGAAVRNINVFFRVIRSGPFKNDAASGYNAIEIFLSSEFN